MGRSGRSVVLVLVADARAGAPDRGPASQREGRGGPVVVVGAGVKAR